MVKIRKLNNSTVYLHQIGRGRTCPNSVEGFWRWTGLQYKLVPGLAGIGQVLVRTTGEVS